MKKVLVGISIAVLALIVTVLILNSFVLGSWRSSSRIQFDTRNTSWKTGLANRERDTRLNERSVTTVHGVNEQGAEVATIMIWSNLPATSESSNWVDGISSIKGSHFSPDGKRFVFAAESTDGKTSTFQIDETDYDCDNGALFLVDASTAKVRIKQIKIDPQKLRCHPDKIHDLENDLPEIKSFFLSDSAGIE